MKRVMLSLLLCLSVLAGTGQEARRFRFLSWNVENLFDTLHDEGHDDLAFLPDGEYGWDSSRYWRKQGNLARIILDACGLQPVDIVGLYEVENDSVIRDLTRRTRMASLGYEYVVTESEDLRGVDVALLYQPATFRLLSATPHRVPHDAESERPTRDILHCSGVLPLGDTLDVVLVHFPSRRGGVKASEPYRLRAATVVRHIIDSLNVVRQQPSVVVMGDCNDEPRDKSVRLMAGDNLQIMTSDPDHPKDIFGTYYYQHAWSQIDNMLVSRHAIERYAIGRCQIFAPEHLIEYDAEGFPLPRRTYRGPSYHGGISDHLPLLLDLWY